METNGNPVMIRCDQCGAPAEYNILQQKYCCAYCGSKVSAAAVLKEKNGWKEAKKLRSAEAAAALSECIYRCSGCGAKVMIPEGEALGKCGFCGGKVVRREYAEGDTLPETIIPFVLSREEALAQLEAWCAKNAGRPEAKILQKNSAGLTGYYLPYRLVKGAAGGEVCTNNSSRRYSWQAELDEIAINASRQIPNELLDAVEPFEWDQALEFDFGMLAGQRVKLQDINAEQLARRTSDELTSDFQAEMKAKFHTKGIAAKVDPESLFTLNAALPAYVLDCGRVKMAINGQTGHIAVTKEKIKKRDLSILEPIIITLLLFLVSFSGFYFFGHEDLTTSLEFGAGIMVCFGIVTFCFFSQRDSAAARNEDLILRTTPVRATRENGRLSITESPDTKKKPRPVIVEEFKSTGLTPVDVRIYSPSRILRWVFFFLVLNGSTVALALLVNGFNFARLDPGGSAVWWCLSVPTSFILYLKVVRSAAFDRPYFYYLKDGRRGKRVPKHEYLGQEGRARRDLSGLKWMILAAGAVLAVLLLISVMLTAGIW